MIQKAFLRKTIKSDLLLTNQLLNSVPVYTPSGKIGTITHGNGSSTTYNYDARSEKLEQAETKRGSQEVIQKKTYEYTSIGEINEIDYERK